MTLHVSNTGNGPHLSLLHGWGLHGGIWQDTIDDLKEKWTVTVVDLPGHGKSDMRLDTYTLQTLAAEVAQVLPQPTTLLGWSLGGMIAMQIAADFPERITKLVLVATTPQFFKSIDWPYAVEPQILEVFANNLKQDFHSTVKHFLALQVLGSSDERNTLNKLQRLAFSRGTPDPRALESCLVILSQVNMRQLAKKLVCPTLLINGLINFYKIYRGQHNNGIKCTGIFTFTTKCTFFGVYHRNRYVYRKPGCF